MIAKVVTLEITLGIDLSAQVILYWQDDERYQLNGGCLIRFIWLGEASAISVNVKIDTTAGRFLWS